MLLSLLNRIIYIAAVLKEAFVRNRSHAAGRLFSFGGGGRALELIRLVWKAGKRAGRGLGLQRVKKILSDPAFSLSSRRWGINGRKKELTGAREAVSRSSARSFLGPFIS